MIPPTGHRIAIAPMMNCSDRHDRFLLRLITRRALLYTEMVHVNALLHGDPERHLAFDASEHPVALQVGGSEPEPLARAARLAMEWGYDEINLNVGCPSDRVQHGRFGACLMADPGRVAACVAAMREAVDVPVTVKTRIGIDADDHYEFLARFVERVSAAGCSRFSVHARKAWLQGVSPKANREIPPLRYEHVYRLKREMQQLHITVNGGVRTLDAAETHLREVDGVMIGREAYHNPYMLADVDRRFYGDTRPARTRGEVLDAFAAYAREQLEQGVALGRMARHVLGLFQGRPGARAWRRHISEHAHRRDAGVDVLDDAARHVA